MTADKKSPGAVNAGAEVAIAGKQDLSSIFPPASQDLASVLREASYEERNKLIETFCDYYADGVPRDAVFEIHWDKSPKDGLLISMSVEGKLVTVAILDYRPAFVFDVDAMRSVALKLHSSDPLACMLLDVLRNWRRESSELTDAKTRRGWIADLDEERLTFNKIMVRVLQEIDNPRNWYAPIAPSCKIYVAPAPSRKAAQ